jgi:hypothetical protein
MFSKLGMLKLKQCQWCAWRETHLRPDELAVLVRDQAIFREDVVVIGDNCGRKTKSDCSTRRVNNVILRSSGIWASVVAVSEHRPGTWLAELLGDLDQIGSSHYAHGHILLPRK